MTEEQKKKIIELRKLGLGYKKIAKHLGITRDSVRGYCRRNEPFGEYIPPKKKKANKTNKVEKSFCLNCNTEIIQSGKGPKRKYCCNKCRYEYVSKNGNRRAYSLRCEYCEKEFKAYSVKRKYCSHDCYIRDRFWRKEDASEFMRDILSGEKIDKVPKWLKDNFKNIDNKKQ